ncbi:hypothetical protein BC833DRAFT_574088 [Globomyces pollinis-pini]|nr:hypothetical protein BC833DRAFT_574088 [Globomyces pollinis-pini]
MDLLHESREGNRGGLGLFNWEDVKADKDREHYLGHSIKASTGRYVSIYLLIIDGKKTKVIC